MSPISPTSPEADPAGSQGSATLQPPVNYDSPSDIRAFLAERGWNTLKRWGQNFMINPGARQQLARALELEPGERVWEIGPGLGAMTWEVLAQGNPVTLFEIDPAYGDILTEYFGGQSGFRLVRGDVVKTWKAQLELDGLCKVMGNLPYNAASMIITGFIQNRSLPPVMVITIQKEMAQRMLAAPGTSQYSSFSVLCQSYYAMEKLVELKPGSFYPSPEVSSTGLRLKPLVGGAGDLRRDQEGLFQIMVRELFSSRRKTLHNNILKLGALLGRDPQSLEAPLESLGISPGARAETLTPVQFQTWAKLLLP